MVVVVFIKKKKPKTFFSDINTHVYKASFITDAVLMILNVSMDLAVGMLTEGTNLW